MRGDAFDPEVVDAFLRREADFDRIRVEKMEEVILPEIPDHAAHG
jgi:hypothetical protein